MLYGDFMALWKAPATVKPLIGVVEEFRLKDIVTDRRIFGIVSA